MLAVYTIVLFVAGYTVSTPELVGDFLHIDIFNALLPLQVMLSRPLGRTHRDGN